MMNKRIKLELSSDATREMTLDDLQSDLDNIVQAIEDDIINPATADRDDFHKATWKAQTVVVESGGAADLIYDAIQDALADEDPNDDRELWVHVDL